MQTKKYKRKHNLDLCVKDVCYFSINMLTSAIIWAEVSEILNMQSLCNWIPLYLPLDPPPKAPH